MKFIVRLLRAIANFIVNLLKALNQRPTTPIQEPTPNPEPEKPIKPSIIEDLIPIERANRPGYALTPKFITIHDTGNPNVGANAKAHSIYIKGETAAKVTEQV